MNNEIQETLKKADNEATAAPYWLVLDPAQNMRCDIYVMAHGITGPFFSREDAQNFLNSTRYNFSKKAQVYCCSGHNSYKYDQMCRKI